MSLYNLLMSSSVFNAFNRFTSAVGSRENATRTLEAARVDASTAVGVAVALERRASSAETLLDDAQTEYEAATAELTRALGGKAFDPASGNLI